MFSAEIPVTRTALRGYQQRALHRAATGSCIVVLPTGSGKTLVAAAACRNRCAATGRPALFLVPTCLLVAQQAAVLRRESALRTCEYMGGAQAPVAGAFDVLVSTPAAYLALAQRAFAASTFALVVFDEVHHVIKRHPYRRIARLLADMPQSPRILGLTATLTYAVGSERIRHALEDLCSELGLSPSCIFSATADELSADGYSARGLAAQVDFDEGERCFERTLEIPGRPHETLRNFLRLVRNRQSPLHPLTLQLWDDICTIESRIKATDPFFVSPLSEAHASTREWSEFALSRRKQCAPASERWWLCNRLLHIIYSAASPATVELAVPPAQARATVRDFASGAIRVLIATSVAEEGMDIPAANCVVRFDPIQSSVSLVQSRGRARQEASSFIVLKEDEARTVASLQGAERDQAAEIKRASTLPCDSVQQEAVRRRKELSQRSRLLGARNVLDQYRAIDSTKQVMHSMASLKLYVSKISGELTESYAVAGGVWSATFSLTYFGANPLCSEGTGSSKKEAACKAGHALLIRLHVEQQELN